MKYFLAIIMCFNFYNSSAQTGKIYFSSSERNTPGGLFSIEPNGQNLKQVTNSIARRTDAQPHSSKSGEWLTFNSYRFGGWKIAISDKEGNNVKKLTKGSSYEYDARWSPNGQQITYVGFPSGRSGYRQVFVVNKDGTGRKQLTNEQYSHYTSTFIEGGKKLMFATTENSQFDVYTMNLDGSGKKNLTQTDDVHEIAPALSPDGKYLAYHTLDENDHINLMIYDLSNGRKKEIFSGWKGKEKIPQGWDTPLFPYSISWSPDSRFLAFTSHLGDNSFQIFKIDRLGENPVQLTNRRGVNCQPHWSEN